MEEGRVYLVCILVGGFADIPGNARGAWRGIGRKAVRARDGECLRKDHRIVNFSVFKRSVWPSVNR